MFLSEPSKKFPTFSRLFPDLNEIKWNLMILFEMDETTQKHLHNAFKGRFSWVYQRDGFSKVRFFPAPPNKTANVL